MAMVQTTNLVFDHSLYDKVKSQSLLAWQRVRVANMIAFSGEEWYLAFRKYNSGRFRFVLRYRQ